MVAFKKLRRSIVLEYDASQDAGWVWRSLKTGEATVSKVFTFLREDLVSEPDEDVDDFDAFTYRFRLARTGKRYHHIEGRKLGIPNTVLIAKDGVDWRRKLFAAHRDISIFGRISKIVGPDAKIVVGGEREDAIPTEIFDGLIKRFPNSYELDRYAEARVANVIGDYVEPLRDFQGHYETYMNKRAKAIDRLKLEAPALIETEIEKFELVRDTLSSWLEKDDRTEREWQEQLVGFLLLLFPKYVAVLEEVPVVDRYTDLGRKKKRRIDIGLLDVSGNIDVVEIKRPSAGLLLRKTTYRDNHVPTGTLAGTVVQAEKYLFHLGKGGRDLEVALTERFADILPTGMEVRITNPRAMIILGRDRNPDGSAAFDRRQESDLEIIRRKYANVMDIITYDDLLRRLDRIIASLQRRKEEGL
jgi:hypothetical protein